MLFTTFLTILQRLYINIDKTFACHLRSEHNIINEHCLMFHLTYTYNNILLQQFIVLKIAVVCTG